MTSCPRCDDPDEYPDVPTVPSIRRACRAVLVCADHVTPAALHLARFVQATQVERRAS